MYKLKRDTIHCNLRNVDRYDKMYNFIISAREYGKSTSIWTKIWKGAVHKHRPSVVIRRMSIDITEAYVDSIAETINQFLPENKHIKLYYKKGAIKEGTCDVFLDKNYKHQICRIVALNVPKSRMKSLILRDPYLCLFDEYIIDTMEGEKYLPDEINRFKDLYNTYYRHAAKYGHKMKCYFMGNPYTVFSPYHLWLNIPLNEIHEGCKIIGQDFYFECAKLSEELKEHILKVNPLYKFDDTYTRYAFGAQAVNDDRFTIVDKRPDNYYLKFIFKIDKRYVYVWQNNGSNPYDLYKGKFWIESSTDSINTRVPILAIDFNNLTEGTRLWLPEMKGAVLMLKFAISRRDVTYRSVEAGYYIQEIYKVLK